MQTSALATPAFPHPPCPAVFVPAPGAADAPHTAAVASPDAASPDPVDLALIHLAAQRHLLAKAVEWAFQAERTHTEPVTGPGGRLYVRAHAYTPADIARRRTHAAARVAECEARLDAAHRRVEVAMRAVRDAGVEVVW